MKQLTPQKSVNYHGINLIVPNNTKWLATDKSCLLCAYFENEPYDTGYNEWNNLHSDRIFICQVDLEGMDWRDSLVEVK
jgi:hypothetical protein